MSGKAWKVYTYEVTNPDKVTVAEFETREKAFDELLFIHANYRRRCDDVLNERFRTTCIHGVKQLDDPLIFIPWINDEYYWQTLDNFNVVIYNPDSQKDWKFVPPDIVTWVTDPDGNVFSSDGINIFTGDYRLPDQVHEVVYPPLGFTKVAKPKPETLKMRCMVHVTKGVNESFIPPELPPEAATDPDYFYTEKYLNDDWAEAVRVVSTEIIEQEYVTPIDTLVRLPPSDPNGDKTPWCAREVKLLKAEIDTTWLEYVNACLAWREAWEKVFEGESSIPSPDEYVPLPDESKKYPAIRTPEMLRVTLRYLKRDLLWMEKNPAARPDPPTKTRKCSAWVQESPGFWTKCEDHVLRETYPMDPEARKAAKARKGKKFPPWLDPRVRAFRCSGSLVPDELLEELETTNEELKKYPRPKGVTWEPTPWGYKEAMEAQALLFKEEEVIVNRMLAALASA